MLMFILQRKWLIENRVDLDVEKATKTGKETPEPLSTALSPTLGPRSPIVEKEGRGGLKKRSKSEMNISKLSYTLSPPRDVDNAHLSSPVGHPVQTGANTSTPKYATLGSSRSPQKQQQPQQVRAQHSNRYLPQTPQLNSTRSNVNGEFATSSPLRSRSAVGFGHDDPQHVTHSNAVESSDNSDIRRQNSGSSVGSGSIGSYNARQGAVNTTLSPTAHNPSHFRGHPHTTSVPHQRYPSSDSSGDRGLDRSLPRNQPVGPRGAPQPMKASYIPPEHSQADRYNPDTLRSVTQNYQRNVQHSLSPHNSHKSLNSSASSSANVTSSPVAQSSPFVQQQQRSYQSPEIARAHAPQNQATPLNKLQYRGGGPSGQAPSSNPVAPPRRTRPVSAGPLRSSGAGSAFSTPTPSNKSMQRSPSSATDAQRERPQTAHNSSTVNDRPHNAHSMLTSHQRTQPSHLSSPPSHHEQSVRNTAQARPDTQTSNRSAHDQNNGASAPSQPGKKPVWYEYGCV